MTLIQVGLLFGIYAITGNLISFILESMIEKLVTPHYLTNIKEMSENERVQEMIKIKDHNTKWQNFRLNWSLKLWKFLYKTSIFSYIVGFILVICAAFMQLS